jgi:hypothetical protein
MAEKQYEKDKEGHRPQKEEKEGQMTTEEAGHLGGQKVKRLIEEGKEAEEEKRPKR